MFIVWSDGETRSRLDRMIDELINNFFLINSCVLAKCLSTQLDQKRFSLISRLGSVSAHQNCRRTKIFKLNYLHSRRNFQLLQFECPQFHSNEQRPQEGNYRWKCKKLFVCDANDPWCSFISDCAIKSSWEFFYLWFFFLHSTDKIKDRPQTRFLRLRAGKT